MAAELKINWYPVCFLCDLNCDEKFPSSIQVFEIRLSRLVISYGTSHIKSDPHHLDVNGFGKMKPNQNFDIKAWNWKNKRDPWRDVGLFRHNFYAQQSALSAKLRWRQPGACRETAVTSTWACSGGISARMFWNLCGDWCWIDCTILMSPARMPENVTNYQVDLTENANYFTSLVNYTHYRKI